MLTDCCAPAAGENINSWVFDALLSAIAAGATAILAKIGIQGVPPNLATAVRTVVVMTFAWGIVPARGEAVGLRDMKGRTRVLLVLSEDLLIGIGRLTLRRLRSVVARHDQPASGPCQPEPAVPSQDPLSLPQVARFLIAVDDRKGDPIRNRLAQVSSDRLTLPPTLAPSSRTAGLRSPRQ